LVSTSLYWTGCWQQVRRHTQPRDLERQTLKFVRRIFDGELL